MLQPVLNFSKQWPRAVVTLALGGLLLWILTIAFPINLGFPAAFGLMVGEQLSDKAYAQALFIGLVSYTLGATGLLLGEAALRFPKGTVGKHRLDELRLEVAIFETANAMLIERYQRTRFLADVVAGFSATLLIGCVALFFRSFIALFATSPINNQNPGWEVYGFTYFMFAVMAGCVFLAKRSLHDFQLLVEEMFPHLLQARTAH